MLDLTVGAGGHAREILGRVGEHGMVIGLDRDIRILEIAEEELCSLPGRVELRESCSDSFDAVLGELGVTQVQGILLDLGVSSLQLDEAGRGFSFRRDGPLDMRMSAGKGRTAQALLEEISLEELERILSEFGGEPSARRIARRLKELCERRVPRTTLELANFIESLHPVSPKGRRKVHPATRTFQALRMAVNDEIGQLERTLPKAVRSLSTGGILAVISFHSAEDRVVKQFFKRQVKAEAIEILTKKPITPTPEELRRNPRSRSAKLRAARRVQEEASA